MIKCLFGKMPWALEDSLPLGLPEPVLFIAIMAFMVQVENSGVF